jgi:hypothetical protein
MGDWKSEPDALMRETAAFVSTVKNRKDCERPPRAPVEQIELKPLHFGSGSKRGYITDRVERFRAHQQRLIREREEYAESVLLKMRSSTG